MSISATNINNKSSRIQTNGNLSLIGSNLTNEGFSSANITTNVNRSVNISEKKYQRSDDEWSVWNGDVITSVSTTSTVTDPGDTFITAGGNITGSFTGSIDNISVKQGVAPVSITQGSANVHATSATIGTPTTESINSGLALPTGVDGLFVQTTDPTSKYILETNPAVSTLGALYGSSYFESKMGINLATEVKRLGNDDYETRLVRDQILATTHKRFLSTNVTSDTDQYKALMDNALAQHTGLKLSYGVELTSAQVSALTSDIVWMVEVTLADGRKALKPVVYFAEATRMNIDSSGALIVAGEDLNLTAANDITNSGTLSGAKTTLASTSGSITNSYGKLAATNGDLSVTADQNITNTGGLITGQNVALTATNGDFTNTTETWRQSQTIQKNYQGVWGNDKAIAYNDTTGAKARITATGGNLSIISGKDITDSGATSISATGDATLSAGGNVNLQALTTQTRGLVYQNPYESVRTVTQTGANLSAGGNLAITSGAQTTLHGTKAEAGGDLSISSSTDTVIAATQTSRVVERGDGGFGQVWSTEVKNDLVPRHRGFDGLAWV